MEAVLRLLTPLQSILQAVALAAALAALYELVADADWRRRPIQTAGRVCVVALCGVVGIAGLAFGQNAVLTFADRVGAPLFATQAAFVTGLLLSILAWAKD